MSERYFIGAMATQFGISTDTLRLYDEMGILPAHRDENNGYRYYHRDDLICLSYILRLRRTGMSLEDIRFLVTDGAPEKALEMMTAQRERIAEQIRDLQMIYAFTGDYIDTLRSTQQMLGRYRLSTSPRMLLFPFVPDMESVMDAFHTISTERIPHFSFIVPQSLLTGPDCYKTFLSDDPSHWNMKNVILLADQDGTIDVPDGCGIDVLPPMRCMHTAIRCIRGKDYSEISHFIRYVLQQGYRITGDLYSVTSSLRNESERNVDYYKLWLPVEGGPCPDA